MTPSPEMAGAVGSLLAGMATAVGALPILGIGRSAQRYQGVLLGFAAGVMLAASFFSLIIPALAHLKADGAGPLRASLVAAGSVAIGAGMLMTLGRLLPAVDAPCFSGDKAATRSIWLFVLAITLHNAPEGLAVGVSFANGAYAEGSATAFGIGIQNIPEGIAVGCALALRYSPVFAFLGAVASGLVEPVAGTAGAVLVAEFRPLLPWALCIAAGAMISVIMSQIAPAIGQERSDRPHLSFIIGLCLMMVLDVSLT
ncbi:ZIP family metal transporter [Sphingobium bisphenolivorans]|uniref:ZIP family metal transporter n=1 Tax=Sphingobium bisphenolivorans TaxID=1335760 RepID=UPI00039E7EF7|nr:ZIP family metal transporter [Sphingobium bisphenolivorans]